MWKIADMAGPVCNIATIATSKKKRFLLAALGNPTVTRSCVNCSKTSHQLLIRQQKCILCYKRQSFNKKTYTWYLSTTEWGELIRNALLKLKTRWVLKNYQASGSSMLRWFQVARFFNCLILFKRNVTRFYQMIKDVIALNRKKSGALDSF